jgi:hypothetical protein
MKKEKFQFLRIFLIALTIALSGINCLTVAKQNNPDQDTKISFNSDIEPMLAAKCYQCHGPNTQKSGLNLHDQQSALHGGGSMKPAIVPGKSSESYLIQRITNENKTERMPPANREPVTPEEIRLLRMWIDQGADWPEKADPPVGNQLFKQDHWAFQPVVRPKVPILNKAADKAQARNPIDNFILHKLHKRGLSSSAEADRTTLIRRWSQTLTGLPPSPEDVEQFVTDQNPDAYEWLVEQLLASPHYGERWGQHWLDIVRFAETSGFEVNTPRPNAWHYRDYVIQAFNKDTPYNQFILEQLAGDTVGADIATGFLVAGPKDLVGSPDIRLTLAQRMDELHDMINTTGMTFMGLTTGCARCHDHKFDPISQRDYYAMQAVFSGVKHGDRVLNSAEYEANQKKTKETKEKLNQVKNQLSKFEPLAFTRKTLIIDDQLPGKEKTSRTDVTTMMKIGGTSSYTSGKKHGERSDPGDLGRLPNIGKEYTWWKAAQKDVFTWNPRLSGRHQIWLSWGCGLSGRSNTTKALHTTDAEYHLDLDGDLETQDDRKLIAIINQQKLADGSEAPTELVGASGSKNLWSGLYAAGIHELHPTSRIILRGGSSNAPVTADTIVFQQAIDSLNSQEATPQLRPAVQTRQNSERFKPIEAKFVRFTVLETNSGQPCIDELEIYTEGSIPHNVALASAGAKAMASSTLPGYDIHKLQHINDGLYGNSHSWISNETGRGWVEIELAQKSAISRITWGRDQKGNFGDRIPTQYKIEVAVDAMRNWSLISSAEDRIPFVSAPKTNSSPKNNGGLFYPIRDLPKDAIMALKDLIDQAKALDEKLDKLVTDVPMIYAGQFDEPEELTHWLYRGDPFQKRDVVKPGGISTFKGNLNLDNDTLESQRRLKLAQWISDEKNPLTARVMVNRIWHYHFGEGIVNSPSDFGINGGQPSHPKLLDWLASEFKDSGWSIKSIQRLILLSSTYMQSSSPTKNGLEVDADCRLLWRFPPRRLAAEVIRDSILQVSGAIDLTMGGVGYEVFEPNTNYVRVYNPKKEFGPSEWRRMVYQRKIRMEGDATFEAFDCPDGGQVCPKRTRSITALQALNLLNSHFIVQQADLFSQRLRQETSQNISDQVHYGFQLAYGRKPDQEELQKSIALVESHGLPIFCRAIFNTNEFMFIN